MSSYLGVKALACNVIILNISGVLFTPEFTLSACVCQAVGNAMGAGKVKLAYRIYRIVLTYGFIFQTLIWLLAWVNLNAIVGVYTSDLEVQAIAESVFPFTFFLISFDCLNYVMQGVQFGLGQQTLVFWAGLLSFTILDIPAQYLMVYTFGYGLQGSYIEFGLGLVVFNSICFYYLEKHIDWIDIAKQIKKRIEEDKK